MSTDQMEWLVKIVDFENSIPVRRLPYVRTMAVNRSKDGCFICSRRRVSRHHIRRNSNPLVVYLCWLHHQIIHGIALERCNTPDIRTTLIIAREYNLFKES